MTEIFLTVNGKTQKLDVDSDMPLLWILRDELGMTGTKYECGVGVCGACTILDGDRAVRACQVPAAEAQGKRYTTIEGLSADGTHPCQRAWHGYFQAASLHQMHGGFDVDGKLVSWGHKKVSSPHNARRKPTPEQMVDPIYFRDISWGVYDVPYNVPFIETSYVPVATPVPIGPWRAVFSPSSTFARESFFDELAEAAGADPIQFRLDHLDGPEKLTAGDLTIDRARLRRVLEVLRAKSDWNKPMPKGSGRGMACNVYDGDTHVAYSAEVTVRNGNVRVDRVVCVLDCGLIVNPLGIESQIEGGVIWSLSSALKGEITFRNGAAEQSSYRDFEVLRISETPKIDIHLIPSHGDMPFGIGEPTVPPMVPALVNAIYAATGKRVRKLPIRAEDLA